MKRRELLKSLAALPLAEALPSFLFGKEGGIPMMKLSSMSWETLPEDMRYNEQLAMPEVSDVI